MFSNFDLNVQHWYSQYFVYKQVFKHAKINRWCGGKFKCHPQTQKKMGTQALQYLQKQGGATPVLVDS